MRVGIVRDDIQPIYIADIENSSQRNFSSQPRGQSRYFRKPTDAELASAMSTSGVAAVVVGSNTVASVDTSANDTLRIKATSSGSFVAITVTSGATTAKTVIAADLNTAFASNNLPLVADVLGTNALRIRSTVIGPTSYIEIDTVGNGSTLSTAVGFTAGGETAAGVSVSALKTAIYPTSTTIDVSSATITALGTIDDLPAATKSAIVAAIADLVAPQLSETSLVLMSFDRGNIAGLRASNFQPGGAHSGLPAGPAVAVLANDGSTSFTL